MMVVYQGEHYSSATSLFQSTKRRRTSHRVGRKRKYLTTRLTKIGRRRRVVEIDVVVSINHTAFLSITQ